MKKVNIYDIVLNCCTINGYVNDRSSGKVWDELTSKFFVSIFKIKSKENCYKSKFWDSSTLRDRYLIDVLNLIFVK